MDSLDPQSTPDPLRVAPRPIIVIADDLSGAAELAGIAYSQGYSAEVQRRFDSTSDAEVIALDTDSRGLPAEQAADRVAAVARAIVAAKPAWIFKKVDSVLRGNVRAEIESILGVTGQQRAVLLPANPTRRRKIVGGQYLIDTVPLDKTPFSDDPEHPRQSASVAELLGASAAIEAPDTSDLAQLRDRAAHLNMHTLPAGAADFFAALLEVRGDKHRVDPSPASALALELPAVLVCGSRTAWPRRANECAKAGVPIWTLQPNDLDDVQAARQLASTGSLALATGDFAGAADSSELLSRLARLTALVLQRSPVATLLLEGGATAAAVVHRLGWSRFAVAAAAPAGIGVLQPIGVAAAPRLLLKPGSYSWPESVWQCLRTGSDDHAAAPHS